MATGRGDGIMLGPWAMNIIRMIVVAPLLQ